MPRPPDDEPVIAPSAVDATVKLINGFPGIPKMKSEITLNPGAIVITTPKATAADVKNIGVIDPFAPKLSAVLCEGMYR